MISQATGEVNASCEHSGPHRSQKCAAAIWRVTHLALLRNVLGNHQIESRSCLSLPVYRRIPCPMSSEQASPNGRLNLFHEATDSVCAGEISPHRGCMLLPFLCVSGVSRPLPLIVVYRDIGRAQGMVPKECSPATAFSTPSAGELVS